MYREKTHDDGPVVDEEALLALLDVGSADAVDGQGRLHAVGREVVSVAGGDVGVFSRVDKAVALALCQSGGHDGGG